MAVSQLATQTSQTNGQTSNACNLGTISSAGTVVVSAFVSGASDPGGIASITDNHGNTYAKRQEINRAFVWQSEWSFDYASAPGATTLTITPVTGANTTLSFTKAALIDDANTSGSYDIGATGQGLSTMSTSPDVTTSPTATAQASEDVIVGLSWGFGTGLSSWPPSGYTAIGTTQTNTVRNGSMAMGYLTVAATGVQSADCAAQGSSQKWAMALATFKLAGGGTTAYTLSASPGSMAITGSAATTPVARKLSASPGAMQITGAAAILGHNYKMTASPGSITVTGAPATLPRHYFLTASPGAIAITGKATTTPVGRVLHANPGTVTIQGADAAFISPVPQTSGDPNVRNPFGSLWNHPF